MAGFEPTNARVKVWCLTAWRHPNVGPELDTQGIVTQLSEKINRFFSTRGDGFSRVVKAHFAHHRYVILSRRRRISGVTVGWRFFAALRMTKGGVAGRRGRRPLRVRGFSGGKIFLAVGYGENGDAADLEGFSKKAAPVFRENGAKSGAVHRFWKKLTRKKVCDILHFTNSEQMFINEQESVNRRDCDSKKTGDPGASGDRGYGAVGGISISQERESPRLLSQPAPFNKGGFGKHE